MAVFPVRREMPRRADGRFGCLDIP